MVQNGGSEVRCELSSDQTKASSFRAHETDRLLPRPDSDSEFTMLYSVFLSYKPLIFHLSLSFTLSLLLHFLSLPTLILRGLNTYIHPDDVNPNPNKPQSGKVAIRRPSDLPNQGSGAGGSLNGFQSLSSKTASDLKARRKPKDKFEFDEGKAQIFRLRLGDAQLGSRIYFDSYKSSFNCFVVGFGCFCLHTYLDAEIGYGVLRGGSLVPGFLTALGLFRVLISLVRISLDRSAFKRSERQVALIAGSLGFFIGIVICLGIYPSVFGFELRNVDPFGRICVALLSGSIAAFMYMAGRKSARAFWLGTDQTRSNLSIISCGWLAQVVLYGSYLMMALSSLLWIKPFTEILVNKSAGDGKFVGNVGMTQGDFANFRLLCLLASGILQLLALRPNLQMYLNEAVLSWYQRLHASKVPELEYSRAKVFLHNHYLCLALIQFFAPGALVLLFLGLSQLDVGSVEHFEMLRGILPGSAFVKEVALFMAWWVTFTWTIFTSLSLALYRRGIMHIS